MNRFWKNILQIKEEIILSKIREQSFSDSFLLLLNKIKQSHKVQTFINKINQGSVIVEVALALPVVIILLFYVMDLSHIQGYYAKTEMAGLSMVNALQNSKNIIDKNYLLNAHILAWKDMYPSLGMFLGDDGMFPNYHKPVTVLYYVEGNGDGTASCLWKAQIDINGSADDVSSVERNWANINYSVKTVPNNSNGPVKFLIDVEPERIYSSLNIMPGEVKIIVETFVNRDDTIAYGFGNSINKVDNRSAFDLRIINPPRVQVTDNGYNMFHSVVSFSPKHGLFLPTAPR